MKFRYNKLTDSVEPVTQSQDRLPVGWPLVSENMAFDGSVEDAKAIDRAVGAPEVPYDDQGRPVIKDQSTWNKYLKAHGYVNRTSGKGHHALTPYELERAIKRARE